MMEDGGCDAMTGPRVCRVCRRERWAEQASATLLSWVRYIGTCARVSAPSYNGRRVSTSTTLSAATSDAGGMVAQPSRCPEVGMPWPLHSCPGGPLSCAPPLSCFSCCFSCCSSCSSGCGVCCVPKRQAPDVLSTRQSRYARPHKSCRATALRIARWLLCRCSLSPDRRPLSQLSCRVQDRAIVWLRVDAVQSAVIQCSL